MSSKVSSIFSSLTNEYIYKIVNNLTVKVKITKNDFHIPPQLLFNMAARINRRRSFLFVSKVLGKHLPVNPETPLLASSLLASKYMKEVLHIGDDQISLKLSRFMDTLTNRETSKIGFEPFALANKTIFIGFAETATALGHGVFENFKNAFFFHTTREIMENKRSTIHFEEEHSHATSHYCYIEPSQLDNNHPIVLIDDELTTGKTVLNIIQSIQNKYPRQTYTVLTLLDWRSEESIQDFLHLERQLGIEINIVSLVSGLINVDFHYDERKEEVIEHRNKKIGTISHIDLSDILVEASPYYNQKSKSTYLWQTGRFGLDSTAHENIERLAKQIGYKLFGIRSGGRVLCLGTGELMYIPMKIASYMGAHVYFQSTTRSPIYASNNKDYLIRSKYAFPCPDELSIINYFYQIEPNMYDEVFIFFEREHLDSELNPVLKQLARLVPKVNVITLSKGKDDVMHDYGPY